MMKKQIIAKKKSLFRKTPKIFTSIKKAIKHTADKYNWDDGTKAKMVKMYSAES